MKICTYALVSFSLFVSSAMVDAQDYSIPKSIEYIDNGFSFDVYSAIEHDSEILVVGRDRYYRFELENQQFRFPMPHEFDGYISELAELPSGSIVAAGHNYDRIIRFKDRRQNIIAVTDPLKVSPINRAERTIGVVDSRTLSDRLSRGLHVNDDGTIQLLSQDDSDNRIIEFSDRLRKIKSSEPFGVDGDIDMVTTDDGKHIVVGYSRRDESDYLRPTYWVFDKNLSVLTKSTLGIEEDLGTRGNLAQAVTDGNYVYLAYGWDKGAHNSELPDEVTFAKLDERYEKPIWEAPLPFNFSMRAFLTPEGVPYVVFPRVDFVEIIYFDPRNGDATLRRYPRPREPARCFFKYHTFKTVDVVQANDGIEYVIFSKLMSDMKLGCVSIAKFIY